MDRPRFDSCKVALAAFLIAGWVSACGPGVTATPPVEPPAKPNSPATPISTATLIVTATPANLVTPIVVATPTGAVTSTMPEATRAEAESMLVKYGLSIAGEPVLLSEGKLNSGDEAFLLYSDMSKSIGLDLTSHVGQLVQWYSIPLKQRSEAEGSLSAVFIVSAEKIIGAGLHFRRGSPGVAALNQ